MAWPSSDVPTTNLDAGTDNPQTARADLLSLAQAVNLLRNHFSTFMRGLAEAVDAPAARAALGASAVGSNVFTAVDQAAARSAIGAPFSASVVTLTGNQNIAGLKTFNDGHVSISATQLTGYGTGAGTTVTQITSKSTATPAFNAPCGTIITHNQSLAAGASVTFSVASTAVIAGQSVVNIAVHDNFSYSVEAFTVPSRFGYDNGFVVRLTNRTGGALAEAVTLTVSIQRIATS